MGVTILSGATGIGEAAFMNCTYLTRVTIPDSIIRIGRDAFYSCSNLESITIPSSVNSIGYWAFEGCSSLTGIVYEGTGEGWLSLTAETSLGLPENTVVHCTDCSIAANGMCGDSLTWILDPEGHLIIRGTGEMWPEPIWLDWSNDIEIITIHPGMTSIGSNAFADCTNLDKIIIPSSVSCIGENAFSNCTNLTDVWFVGTAELWAAISIENGNDPLTSANIQYRKNL